MNPTHIERIRELFIKLKKGYDWCHKNEANMKFQFVLFERSESIFKELEELGVHRQFSACLFFFGPLVTDELVNQFKNKEGGGNND